MPYNIQLVNTSITVNDGSLNGSTGLQLPGRNFAGYGQPINQSLVDLLQHFARLPSTDQGPDTAVVGQIWFDKGDPTATPPRPESLKVKTAASANYGWKKIITEGSTFNTSEITATTINSDDIITDTLTSRLVTVSGTLTTTKITTGSASTAGTLTGDWTLTDGSRLNATYADLAERFEADCEYDPGTVVELGGEKEITAVKEDCSETVFGVISTNAAYLMNSGAGNNATHPAIAIAGRVPVKVRGQIRKGDRLVSAGNGVARAARKGEATAFNTIGRSLENKNTDAYGSVLATVTAKM
jgi:hypothetical protein